MNLAYNFVPPITMLRVVGTTTQLRRRDLRVVALNAQREMLEGISELKALSSIHCGRDSGVEAWTR